MNPTPDIETFVGDTSPDITFTIYRGADVVDLTGCAVNFKLYNPIDGKQSNLTDETCTVSNPVNGQCVYIWQPGDKPNSGIYRGFIQVTFQDGTVETSKVRVNVLPIG